MNNSNGNGRRSLRDDNKNGKSVFLDRFSDPLEGFGYVLVGVAEGYGAAVGAGGGVFGFAEFG